MAETYTYQQVPGSGVVVRESDNTFIPLDLANQDYQGFLTWVAEGNAAPAGWTGPTNPTASPEPEQAPPLTEGTA